jgi:hypothetical protein
MSLARSVALTPPSINDGAAVSESRTILMRSDEAIGKEGP